MRRDILCALARLSALILMASGCSGSPGRNDAKVVDPSNAPAFVALLENNVMRGLNKDGRTVWRVSLGPAPKEATGGRYITSAGNRRLAVVISGTVRDQLALTSTSGHVVRRFRLPRGVRFRAIAYGQRTRRFYLAGEFPTTHRSEFDDFVHLPVVVVVSSSGRSIAQLRLHNLSRGTANVGLLDWRVYDIALTRDERRLFVSYHGPNTGGADWIDIRDRSLERCARGSEATCIPAVHGSLEAYHKGLLATLGTPPLLGQFTHDGRRSAIWRSRLANAHLMEFARMGDQAYVIETCTKTGGLSMIDLARDRTTILAAPAPVVPLQGLGKGDVCGERVAVGDERIVVMKRGTVTGISGLLVMNSDGQRRLWIPLSPPPFDLAALP